MLYAVMLFFFLCHLSSSPFPILLCSGVTILYLGQVPGPSSLSHSILINVVLPSKRLRTEAIRPENGGRRLS